MSDQAKFGADAREYFAVVDQMRGKLNELGQAHERAGSIGFANEYRVDRQARFLVGSLLQAKSASEGAGAALVAFALAADLPLGIAIAGVVAGETILKIARSSEETTKAFIELEGELNKPFGAQIHLSSEGIGNDLDKLAAKAEALKTKMSSASYKFLNYLKGDFISGPTLNFNHGPSPEAAALVEAETRLKQLANAQADAELRAVAVKRRGVEASKAEGAAEKANLDFEQKAAKVIEEAAEKADRFDFDRLSILFKRIAALKQERDLTLEIVKAQQQDQLKKDQGKRTTLAQDIGSGKFLRDLDAERQAEADRLAGEQIIAEDRAARAGGARLGPNATAILKATDEADAVVAGDYSGLAALDGLQFTGLRALDGLTITIK